MRSNNSLREYSCAFMLHALLKQILVGGSAQIVSVADHETEDSRSALCRALLSKTRHSFPLYAGVDIFYPQQHRGPYVIMVHAGINDTGEVPHDLALGQGELEVDYQSGEHHFCRHTFSVTDNGGYRVCILTQCHESKPISTTTAERDQRVGQDRRQQTYMQACFPAPKVNLRRQLATVRAQTEKQV